MKREPILSKTIWKETNKKEKSFKDYNPPRTQACPFAHCKQNQNQNMHRWRNLFFSSLVKTRNTMDCSWWLPAFLARHGFPPRDVAYMAEGNWFPSMEQWSFSLCRGVKPRPATWRCSCQHLSWEKALVCVTRSTRQPCRGDNRRLGGIVASGFFFLCLEAQITTQLQKANAVYLLLKFCSGAY